MFSDNPLRNDAVPNADESVSPSYLLYQVSIKETSELNVRVSDINQPLERVASIHNLSQSLLNVSPNDGASEVDGQSV